MCKGNLTDTLERLGVTGLVASTILVRLALNLVAPNVGVGRVTTVLGRTRAERFVSDGLALSQGCAEGKLAGVLAHFPS